MVSKMKRRPVRALQTQCVVRPVLWRCLRPVLEVFETRFEGLLRPVLRRLLIDPFLKLLRPMLEDVETHFAMEENVTTRFPPRC